MLNLIYYIFNIIIYCYHYLRLPYFIFDKITQSENHLNRLLSKNNILLSFMTFRHNEYRRINIISSHIIFLLTKDRLTKQVFILFNVILEENVNWLSFSTNQFILMYRRYLYVRRTFPTLFICLFFSFSKKIQIIIICTSFIFR